MTRTLVAVLIGLAFAAPAPAADPVARPNVLFVLTDDQGWPSLGCYGGTKVPTPHLDRLAADGVRFTRAYVTPQCTPTRAALLTGQHPARTRMWHVIPWYGYPWAPVAEPAYREHLPRAAFTLAKGLKAAGYATGIAGKWHLTANDDGNYVRLTADGGRHYGFDHVAPPGPVSPNEGDKHVEHYTDEAEKFIDANKGRPWFFYLTHHTLHGKVSAPTGLVKKYRAQGAPEAGHFNATYLAAIEHLDSSVGRLLAALDKRKLRDDTLVVFLSDNGGVGRQYDPAPFTKGGGKLDRLTVGLREYPNDPLRGEKGTLYEGGIRVPCLVRWPRAAKAGLVCDTPVQATDWLPTLFEAAGAKPPEGYPLDGRSLAPLLSGGSLPERSLYWYAPLYDLRWGATPAAAVRRGHYKLVEHFGDSFDDAGRYRPGNRLELYDLKTDPGEATDLAAKAPDRVKALRDDLHTFLKSVNAEIPGANPRHDRARPFLETRQKPAD